MTIGSALLTAYGRDDALRQLVGRGGVMRTSLNVDAPVLTLFAGIIAVILLSGCVRIPAEDDLAQGPTVDEITQRVKCDLYGSLSNRLDAQYGYEWLRSWTSQANLNLIVNDQSQISPGATFVQPLTTQSIPLRVTNMARSWNLGLGAQASNTASRTESLTFTVSMDELKQEFDANHGDCNLPNGIDLQSDLGLKEWLAGALSPVDDGYLNIGYHKAPKTGGGGTAAKATGDAMRTAGAVLTMLKAGAGKPACKLLPDPNPGSPERERARRAMAVVICDLERVAEDAAATGDLSAGSVSANQVLALTRMIKDIQKTIAAIDVAVPALQAVPAVPVSTITTLRNTAKNLEDSAIGAATFVDPPIDTISHQVQFIIAHNASISPSWTLLHFKGPSPSSGALASLSKTRTHTLNIVMGPPSSEDSRGALAALQISTALLNAGSAATVPP